MQSYNRYAYVMNNPLNLTDPSGFSAWTRFRDKVVKPVAIIVIAYFTGTWVGGLYQSAAINSIVAGQGAFTVGSLTVGQTAAILGGAAGGFAGGLAGSNGDIKAGLVGALSGGLFGAVGATFEAGTAASYAGHAATGCITSVAGGGSCGNGAASALFGKFTTNAISGIGGNNLQGDIARGVAASIAGGVGSVIAGGKFENGATTAAFGYLFNCLAHKCNGADYGSEKSGFHEYGPMEQTLCNVSQDGCMAAARQQLMCNSAPGQASCGVPGRLVENNLSGGNPVTQYAVNSDVIINGTSPSHILHDGYVVRWLSTNEAGNVSVWTYGRGNNSNLGTQILNQVGGTFIFLKKGAENRAGVRRALNE